MVDMLFLAFTTVITLITLVVALDNFFHAPRLESTGKRRIPVASAYPFVSVLIPARNEEKNIAACIDAAGVQTYPHMEIVVLDDDSSDTTLEIVHKYIKTSKPGSVCGIRLIRGKRLPPGWTGKNWACFQLAQEACGDVMLFIDADVVLAPHALQTAVSEMEAYKADILSCFPVQITRSFGEMLIVPMMQWILLAFLPLKLVFESKNPAFSAANGQFLMFSKHVYQKIGTHAAFKDNVAEDIEMVRSAKKAGFFPVTAVSGKNIVVCRMYRNFLEAYQGFAKNFYPATNVHLLVFMVLMVFVAVVYFLPFILMLFDIVYIVPVLFLLTSAGIIRVVSGNNVVRNIFLFPLQIVLLLSIGLYSAYVTSTRRAVWKGRKLP